MADVKKNADNFLQIAKDNQHEITGFELPNGIGTVMIISKETAEGYGLTSMLVPGLVTLKDHKGKTHLVNHHQKTRYEQFGEDIPGVPKKPRKKPEEEEE